VSSLLEACSAPMSWAASHTGRVMIAGWTGVGDHSHSAWGAARKRRRRPPGMRRRRPNTWWPVYLGLAKIAVTVETVHPPGLG